MVSPKVGGSKKRQHTPDSATNKRAGVGRSPVTIFSPQSSQGSPLST